MPSRERIEASSSARASSVTTRAQGRPSKLRIGQGSTREREFPRSKASAARSASSAGT